MITEHGLAVTFCPVENEEVLPNENVILPNDNTILPNDNTILPNDNTNLPNDNTILPNENYTFSTINNESIFLQTALHN